MYPSRFRYEAPRSLDQAIDLLHLGGGEAKVLAGGQSLVPLLKLRFAAPELLVDINNLPGLDYHRVDPDGTIRIGALCRHADLERSTILATHAADDGRGRSADRRPDRAQPRHTRRLAVPRRPSGRLGLGGDRTRRPRRRRRGLTAGARSRSPNSSPARSRTSSPSTRSRWRPSSRRRRATAPAATSSWSAASATSRRPASPWRSRPPASWSPARGIALTGVGGSTIDAVDAGAGAGRPAADAPSSIGRAADLAAQAARPRTDHRGSAEYKRHIVHTFVVRILTRCPDRGEGSLR